MAKWRSFTSGTRSPSGAAASVLSPKKSTDEFMCDPRRLEDTVNDFLECCGFVDGQRWPRLEVHITTHEEEAGHTWYRLECTLKDDSEGQVAWHSSKRLSQIRERLHDPIKRALPESEYARHFGAVPFAMHGGLPGTTLRLAKWCGQLATVLSNQELPLPLTALVLRFMDCPEGGVSSPPCEFDRSVDRTCSRLQDDHWYVRLAAVQAIPQIMPRGDPDGIGAIVLCLTDSDAHVRKQAVESLPELAGGENEQAFASVLDLFRHPDPEVRATAVEALCGISEQGDERSREALNTCLADEAPAVQKAAAKALQELGLSTPGLDVAHGSLRHTASRGGYS